jgi:hypothetical protein
MPERRVETAGRSGVQISWMSVIELAPATPLGISLSAVFSSNALLFTAPSGVRA